MAIVVILGDRRVQVVEVTVDGSGSDHAGHVTSEPHTSIHFRCRDACTAHTLLLRVLVQAARTRIT